MFRIMAVLLLFVAPTIAWADPYVAPGHHQFHSWYKQIQAELGIYGCCDSQNNDCGPVQDNYIDLGMGGVKVLLEDGNWHVIQNTKKYYVDTPDDGAHVCRKPIGISLGFAFYCVFLPIPAV